LFLLIAAGLLYLTTSSIDQALTTARRNAAAMQQTNRELNAIRASLEDRVAERTAQLNLSAEVAQAVSSILEPNDLLSQVTRLIVERFNLYYAAAFLVDEDNEFAALVEATGKAGQTLKERGHRLEISGPSVVGIAIATHRPRICKTWTKRPCALRTAADRDPIGSGAAVDRRRAGHRRAGCAIHSAGGF
jgi:hypothetical protein